MRTSCPLCARRTLAAGVFAEEIGDVSSEACHASLTCKYHHTSGAQRTSNIPHRLEFQRSVNLVCRNYGGTDARNYRLQVVPVLQAQSVFENQFPSRCAKWKLVQAGTPNIS